MIKKKVSWWQNTIKTIFGDCLIHRSWILPVTKKQTNKNILQKAALAISDHTTYRQGSTEGGGRFSWNVIG